MKKKRKITKIDIFVFIAFLLFSLAGVLVSLHRYWQYDIFYIDFGIFDQAIYEVAHFQPPVIEHFIVSGKWIFADHFNPSIFLLSPLYWISSKSEIILSAQAIIVGLGGLVLYDIAKIILKNKLPAASIVVAYYLFTGLQNAVITEFHELTIMTLPLMLTLWAFTKNKKFFYFVFFIITLGFKEALFTLGIALGISVLVLRKKWWKIGLTTILISIVWGYVAIKFVIPYFSSGSYIYSPNLPQGLLPKFFAFVDKPEKRHTLFYSFWSFSFLPLFSPSTWILLIQDYGSRFLPEGFSTRWNLGLHYNAESAVLLSFSSIYGLQFLKAFFKKKFFFTVASLLIILNAFFLYRFVLRGPFGLSYNKDFYRHSHEFAFLNTPIAKVPKDETVMAQNNLAARFTHQRVWLLRDNYMDYKPKYIVADLRSGQNPNDFFGTSDAMRISGPDDAKRIIDRIKIDPKYMLIYHKDDQYVFKRR
jgi:uncharacterized membrane protein